MTNLMKLLTLTLAASGLAACQKSACDGALPNDRVKASDQLVACLNSLEVTPAADMPTSGKATYTGLVAANVDTLAGTDALVGDAKINAKFGAGTVSGTMKNFQSEFNGAMSGQLAMTGGAISGNAYSANVGGTLGYGAGTLSVTGTSVGVFLGEDADMVVGDVQGTATVSGSGYSGPIDGGILAKK